jgi:hypothetical protein
METKINIDKFVASIIEAFPAFKEEGRIPCMYAEALEKQGLMYKDGEIVEMQLHEQPSGDSTFDQMSDELIEKIAEKIADKIMKSSPFDSPFPRGDKWPDFGQVVMYGCTPTPYQTIAAASNEQTAK